MKKIIAISIFVIFLLPTMALSQENNDTIQQTNADFTHTVFAEYATTTWCPNCPTAAEALHSIYETDQYELLYVTLVSDENEIAQQRSWRGFKTVAIPTVYFDGGSSLFVGHSGSVQATANTYSQLIEENGVRDVKSIDLDTQVTWDGNAKITVSVTVTNNGPGFYIGKIRSYITEIESRWDDNDGNPYHFALLDFAIDKILFMTPGNSKTFTKQWDGAADHSGLTFEDIEQDNIEVFSATFNWIPHYREGYESDQYKQQFFAFFADQADSAIPI